jgi:hypothetical protein
MHGAHALLFATAMRTLTTYFLAPLIFVLHPFADRQAQQSTGSHDDVHSWRARFCDCTSSSCSACRSCECIQQSHRSHRPTYSSHAVHTCTGVAGRERERESVCVRFSNKGCLPYIYFGHATLATLPRRLFPLSLDRLQWAVRRYALVHTHISDSPTFWPCSPVLAFLDMYVVLGFGLWTDILHDTPLHN